MTEIKDGGPISPIPRMTRNEDGSLVMESTPGMSLRDWFAGQALNGLIAQSQGSALGSDPHVAGVFAYLTADAMIALREMELKL